MTVYIFFCIVQMAAARPTFRTITAQAPVEADVLETISGELATLQQTIEGQLGDVSVYFARILKHAAHFNVNLAKANEDWRVHYLETLQTDLEKLRRLSDELERVHTIHPYCTGCNDPDGFQNNQMAHTCLNEDSDSDED